MSGLISSLGLGSGMDLQGLLDKLAVARQQPVVRLEAQKASYGLQLAEYGTINTNLLSLKSSADALKESSAFEGRAVSISNPDILDATVDDTAMESNYSLNVTQLAKAEVLEFVGLSSKDDDSLLADGDFTFHAGSDAPTTVDTTGLTLQELADAINEAEAGVNATIINDGSDTNPYHLVLNGSQTGADGDITIDATPTGFTYGNDANFSNGESLQAAQDAQFTLNGVSFARSSNTINDVLTGLSLTLNDEGTSNLAVKSSVEEVESNIREFVDAYNTAIEEIRSSRRYDATTETAGVLAGDSTLLNIDSQITRLLTSPLTEISGDITSLAQLGIEYQQDGTLAIDDAELTEAVESNLDAVKQFFLGDSENDISGLAERLSDQLESITKTDDGVIQLQEDSLESKIARTEENVDNMNQRVDKEIERLVEQFTMLDSLLSELNSESDFLTQQFAALDAS